MLARDGAAGLTVRAIAEEAGCSTTGIYTYFGGKQGLVEAIYLDGFESFDRALADAYSGDDLADVGRCYRAWALANPTHYLVMFGRAVPDFEASDDAITRANHSFGLLTEAVTRFGASDPDTAAYHLYATVHGYVMLELVELSPGGLEDRTALYEAGLQLTLSNLP